MGFTGGWVQDWRGGTGSGVPALTTVATYGALPDPAVEEQVVFVTDVGSVYQWDGAQWNLLTTVTVATSGDLPSSGVEPGDKALVGGTRIWTKAVGPGWAETAPMATVADYASLPGSPETDDVVFVTDRQAVYQYSGASWDLLTAIVVAAVGDLPATGITNGDYALVTDDNALYERTGGAWVRVSPADRTIDPGLSTGIWDSFIRLPWLSLGATQSTTVDPGLSTVAWAVV